MNSRFRKNKYHAKKTEYNGAIYDSKKEALFARKLDLLRKALNPKDRVVEVERQPKFELLPAPNKITYRPDFKVKYADGRIVYYEVKGIKTRDFVMRVKLLKHFHPHIILEVV